MDSPELIIDPHSEVRKLQEIVKNLEQQNEVLRNKQQAGVNIDTGQHDWENDGQVNRNNLNDYDLSTDFAKVKLLDNFMLDDLEDVNFSDLPVDDDSWLYTSPKAATTPQPKEPLLSWVRQDFDRPQPEVESARRALISKLDEAARLKHSSSSPVISTQAYASKSAMALGQSSSRNALLTKSGILPPGLIKPVIDTGTFTRSKKLLTLMHGEGDQPQEVPHVPGARDLSDIENLAKQQEENLRQSLTPATLKAMRAKHAPMEGDIRSCHSPSRFDLEGAYISHHRGSLGSDHSTPPDSPHNSNQNVYLSNSYDSRGRGSLPSTPGLHYQPYSTSDSSLDTQSVTNDGINLTPETARVTTTRLQQPNCHPALGQNISSGVAPGLAQQRGSSLPTPRKQIAKPSSVVRSSLPTFQRSNIPSPKPTLSGYPEDNWREGCF